MIGTGACLDHPYDGEDNNDDPYRENSCYCRFFLPIDPQIPQQAQRERHDEDVAQDVHGGRVVEAEIRDPDIPLRIASAWIARQVSL